MKYYNLLLSITVAVVLIGVIMNIAHVAGSHYVIILGLIGGTFVQSSHIKRLNKHINELEQKF